MNINKLFKKIDDTEQRLIGIGSLLFHLFHDRIDRYYATPPKEEFELKPIEQRILELRRAIKALRRELKDD